MFCASPLSSLRLSLLVLCMCACVGVRIPNVLSFGQRQPKSSPPFIRCRPNRHDNLLAFILPPAQPRGGDYHQQHSCHARTPPPVDIAPLGQLQSSADIPCPPAPIPTPIAGPRQRQTQTQTSLQFPPAHDGFATTFRTCRP